MHRISLYILLVIQIANLNANKIIVSPGQSIKTAVIKAKPGDEIHIKKGVYKEYDIEITKPLKIFGQGQPVIDVAEKGYGLIVKSNNVTIEGVSIKNVKVSFIEEYAAILVDEVSHCSIRNCEFENNFFAIYLAKSSSCVIQHNKIKGKIGNSEASSGNGIHLWYCKDILINGNTVSNHRDGIYFEFVEDTEIYDNNSFGNMRYGLHFMFSHRCSYSYNKFEDNGGGVAVMYTKDVLMKNNKFINNWGQASYGLLLKDITDSEIRDNLFKNNSTAIYFENSMRNHVFKNTFKSNGWAAKIKSNSMDNNFQYNNFENNSFDITTNSKQNFNSFSNNYWDKYRGYDLDRDGTGDVPHRPVKLISVVVEQNPPAMILLRSLFNDILELAESVVPVLTPAELQDKRPKMEIIR